MLSSFKNAQWTQIHLSRSQGFWGTGAFIFREQGIFSNYFQGTKELLGRLLGTREHNLLSNFFFNFLSPQNIKSITY